MYASCIRTSCSNPYTIDHRPSTIEYNVCIEYVSNVSTASNSNIQRLRGTQKYIEIPKLLMEILLRLVRIPLVGPGLATQCKRIRVRPVREREEGEHYTTKSKKKHSQKTILFSNSIAIGRWFVHSHT